MGTVTVAVPRSVCVRPTVWARDLITMEVHLQSTAGSWVCVWSTWTGPRELGAWGEDGIKSSCPFRIDPIDDVAWETRRLGSRDDWQLEQTAIRVPPLCRGWPDAFGRRREGHLYGVDNWRCPSSPRDNWNKIHDPKGAISNPFEADPMFPISSFLRDQRRKTGGKCRGHLGDWTVTGEGVASDQVSQWLVPTAHAHRPQKAAMLSASLIADAVLACSCPECRGGPSWSRTFRVAFSGRRAWIACPAGFGTCGNLSATAALTTLRITSTGSHPHRALCWLPATWLAAGGSQEQRPQVPCHPPAAVLHPPHHDEPPNQRWRGAPPPAPAASRAPAFLPVHPIRLRTWAPGCPFPDGGRTYLNHRHLSGRPPYLVAFFLAFCLFPLCPPPSSTLYTLILPSRRHQPAKPPLHRPPNQRATPNPNPNPLLIESRQSESLT